MKLRSIGMSNVEEIEGVFLTLPEYEQHPAYHPFCVITRPTLFVTCNHGDSWIAVPLAHASGYAMLEASKEERVALWQAGYRMLNLEESPHA